MINPADYIRKMVNRELKHFKKEHMHEIDEVMINFFLGIATGMARQSFVSKTTTEKADIQTRQFLIEGIDDFLKNAPQIHNFTSLSEAKQVLKDSLKGKLVMYPPKENEA